MKQWWRGLQQRERVIVGAAGLLLGLVLLHSLVWEPWRRSSETLAEDIAQAEDDLAWMREAVIRLPASSTTVPAAAGSGTLITRMNRLIGQAGVRTQMKQMKPVSDRELRLRFEAVAFDKLLRLLKDARAQGLGVRELRVLPDDEPGRVNATLVLNDGG